jgi:KipI family sensor histidine kinase inhibitor
MKLALKAYGEKGILAHGLDARQRAGLCKALLAEKPEACLAFVEGFDTVLFLFERPVPLATLAKWLRAVPAVKPTAKVRTVEVPVVYDGPDLKSVAEQTGLDVAEIIQIHSKPVYTVRMSGFTPGFPYLDGLDERLHLPRKDRPRKRIKAGSVAIGGSHAGIYSVGSPGGWHLLGRTELALFDAESARGDAPVPENVFRFAPGDRLRFRPVEGSVPEEGMAPGRAPSSRQPGAQLKRRGKRSADISVRQPSSVEHNTDTTGQDRNVLPPHQRPEAASAMQLSSRSQHTRAPGAPETGVAAQPCLKVVSTGSGIALQDAGRSGWMRYGVPVGGAIDRQAMRAANKLLGNRPEAPVLEVSLQGARLKVLKNTWLALAGADTCPALPAWTAREFRAGEVVEFAAKARGVFACLAVPGGFVADRWFGSVSVDLRSGLGRALKRGDRLSAAGKTPKASTEGIARKILVEEARRSYLQRVTFELLPGPQFDAFSETARAALVQSTWLVSAQSDRTGYRLEGPKLEPPESIPSEPVLPGSFQVPGGGQPIVTMVDGPTVGGYPKIAILPDADRDRLAQCPPGTQLRFRWAKS